MTNPQQIFQFTWPVSTHLFTVRHAIDPLATGLNLDLLLRTLTDPVQIFVNAAADLADATVTLFEAPTTSADGTGLTEVDINRVTPKVSGILVFHTPTVSATGTELAQVGIEAGLDKKTVMAGSAQSNVPFILAGSTDYLIRLNNGNAGNISASSRLIYAPTPRT